MRTKSIDKFMRFIGRPSWMLASMLAGYWMAESGLDAFAFNKGAFLEMVLAPSISDLSRRFLCIGIIAFAVYSRRAACASNNPEGIFSVPGNPCSAVLEISTDGIIGVNEDQQIIFFNKGAEAIFGHASSEVCRRPLDILLPDRFAGAHRAYVKSFIESEDAARRMTERTVQIMGRRKDGTDFPAEASISKTTLDGHLILMAIIRDVSERHAQAAILKHQATHDPLTGLVNRPRLHELLNQSIREAQGKGGVLALILMDLDRFKEINDTLGHHRGDFLLREIGRRLRETLRNNDSVARLGGDEFAVILPTTDGPRAQIVAERIQKSLETPFIIEGVPIAVEPSMGIALHPDHGVSPDSLIQRADIAMYTAKRNNAGWMIYDTKADSHSPRRLALMGELRQVIETGGLSIHYQPKISLKTGDVVGLEALIRWNHAVYGLVPPDQFIPAAEQTGMIRPITHWVLREVRRQSDEWSGLGLSHPISVNLSVRNLQDPRLIDHIAELTAGRGRDLKWLELEITESAIMADPRRAMETIARLKEMGIRMGIDDFGSGYSSLSYLSRLSVDEIKIDKSFVIGMASNANDLVIVRSTIDLGHNLELKVIAEGVENPAAAGQLAGLGCDAAQGYYIGRPMPAADLPLWLKNAPVRMPHLAGR